MPYGGVSFRNQAHAATKSGNGTLDDFDRELSAFLTPEPKRKKAFGLHAAGESVLGRNLRTPDLSNLILDEETGISDARASALRDADAWVNEHLVRSDGGPLADTIII